MNTREKARQLAIREILTGALDRIPASWRWIRTQMSVRRANPAAPEESAACYCLVGALWSARCVVDRHHHDNTDVEDAYTRALKRVWERIRPRVRDRVTAQRMATVDGRAPESRLIWWNDHMARDFREVRDVLNEALS